MRVFTDEIEGRLVLKLDLCGRDGPFEKAEFVGTRHSRMEKSQFSRKVDVEFSPWVFMGSISWEASASHLHEN